MKENQTVHTDTIDKSKCNTKNTQETHVKTGKGIKEQKTGKEKEESGRLKY